MDSSKKKDKKFMKEMLPDEDAGLTAVQIYALRDLMYQKNINGDRGEVDPQRYVLRLKAAGLVNDKLYALYKKQIEHNKYVTGFQILELTSDIRSFRNTCLLTV